MRVGKQSLLPDTDELMVISGNRYQNSRANVSKRDADATFRETSSVAYHGFIGNVRIQTTSKFLARSLRSQVISKKAIAEESKIIVTPSFLKKGFEMRYINSLGRVSRTLNVYPTMKANLPPFMICRQGDLQGLQIALSNRTISPFVVDQYGMTLLHYAASSFQTELCSLLMQLGVNPDETATFGMCFSVPIHSIIPNSGPRNTIKSKCLPDVAQELRRLINASVSRASIYLLLTLKPAFLAQMLLN